MKAFHELAEKAIRGDDTFLESVYNAFLKLGWKVVPDKVYPDSYYYYGRPDRCQGAD